MLGEWRTHQSYKAYLKSEIQRLLPQYKDRFEYYKDLLNKLWLLDLDLAKPIVASRYSSIGRPSYYQPELIRALIAMTHLKLKGIKSLVKTLKSDLILDVICGFNPAKLPGIGTFYDLFARWWLRKIPKGVIRRHCKKPKFASESEPKRNEKLQERRPGITKKLVKRLKLKELPIGPELLLQKIMTECTVKPSADMGLLGDVHNLVFAGDGAPLQTGASSHGKPTCKCREKGIHKCTCPRSYSDPDANRGWDSYHKQWYFGHTLYAITSASSPKDLPVVMMITQASRHDSVSFVFAYERCRYLMPDLLPKKITLDSAHDAEAIYELLYCDGVEPFIDINGRAKVDLSRLPVKIDPTSGAPICAIGRKMSNWGFNKIRCRIKWRCPCHEEISLCPLGESCTSSKYGRVVYTKPSWDYRVITPTPRDSSDWKQTFAMRTSVERTHKRILVDYQLERAKVRSKARWFWRTILAAMNVHLDAQVKTLSVKVIEQQ